MNHDERNSNDTGKPKTRNFHITFLQIDSTFGSSSKDECEKIISVSKKGSSFMPFIRVIREYINIQKRPNKEMFMICA